MLDSLCRTAMSPDVNDQLLAARLFLEQTQHGEERQHDELVNKAMGILSKLMGSGNSTVQTHAIQTIALLARNPKYHPPMAAHQYLQRLLEALQSCREPRVLEALLAALTHLAKSHSACTIICERGFDSLLPLLDSRHSHSVGVQCNTLALIGALASHASLQEYMISHDVLSFLYTLREPNTQADIRLNARFCLKAMGYTDDDPTPEHQQVLDAAVSMGFPRGRCEQAIRTIKMNRGNAAGDDMQAVSTYLLDHNNEPPPAALVAVGGGGGDIHRSAIPADAGSAAKEEERRMELQLRRDKVAGIRRVARERAEDVRNLLECGFNRKEAILSLYYQPTLDSAIEWIVKRQEWKRRRQERGAALASGAAGGAAAGASGGGRDAKEAEDEDEESKEEQADRERSASKESGYDSEGLSISDFDDDADAASDRQQADDDWETVRPPPDFPQAMPPLNPQQRTVSVPAAHQPLPQHPPHGQLPDAAIAQHSAHTRSQSTSVSALPASYPSSKYHTLPAAAAASPSISASSASSSSSSGHAAAPSSPPPFESVGSDERRQQEASAMMDWLQANSFSEYALTFSEQLISVDTLSSLTDKDLMDLGMRKLGDRRRFMLTVREWQDRERERERGHREEKERERERAEKEREAASKTSSGSSTQPSSPALRSRQLPADSLDDSADGGESREKEIASVSLLRPQSPVTQVAAPVDSVEDAAAAAEHEDTASPPQLLDPAAGKSSKGFLHFAFLQSMPLRHSEIPGISKKLDLSKETAELQMALNESGKQFRVGWEIATKDNLLKMMAYSRALHISGHGDPNSLVLEDGKGDLAPLPVDRLQRILSVGGTQLQFVFVSACFSSRAAYAFAVAGVPHVIAVQEDTQVTDTSARAFAHHVYLALCQGLTVKEAFLKGQAAVIAANSYNPPCCCAHLHTAPLCSTCEVCRTPVCCSIHEKPCHASATAQRPTCCQPSLPHDESLKFLLLPVSGDHNVPLFHDSDVADGMWINKTPPKPPNNLPSGPDDFMGRAKDALAITPQVLRHRLFLITGARGIGKSALARAVASYINDRRHFFASYLIRLHDATSTVHIDVAIAKVLKLAYDSQHPERVHDAVVHHLQHVKRDNKSFLFIFDDCDQLAGDDVARIDGDDGSRQQEQSAAAAACPPSGLSSAATKRAFRSYIQSFLDETLCHILLTSDASPGSIDGHTLRVHTLQGLHALDLAALFVNRLPRDIKPDDLRLHLKEVTNLNDLLPHPLFSLMAGLPRMAEWCAELLNYTKLDQLYSLLSCEPVLDWDPQSSVPGSRGRTVVLNSPLWPSSLPTEAKTLLRKCQALMISRAGGLDKWKESRRQEEAADRQQHQHRDAEAAEAAASSQAGGPGGAAGGGHSSSAVAPARSTSPPAPVTAPAVQRSWSLSSSTAQWDPLRPVPTPAPAAAEPSAAAAQPLPAPPSRPIISLPPAQSSSPLPPLPLSGVMASHPAVLSQRMTQAAAAASSSLSPPSSSSFVPLHATSVSFLRREQPQQSEPAGLSPPPQSSLLPPSPSPSPSSSPTLSPSGGQRLQSECALRREVR